MYCLFSASRRLTSPCSALLHRFLNLPGVCTIVYASQFLDSCGVGHCGWAMYYVTRGFFCAQHMDPEDAGRSDKSTKPALVSVRSAEILAAQQAASHA